MRARYYSPDLKRFMNSDIIEGSIADSTILNQYAYVKGSPISYVEFGLSAERGQNDNVISNLKGIYDIAYNFYSHVYDAKRMHFANDAVMKYIIYQRLYESGGRAKKMAWEEIAGTIDYRFIHYMEQYPEYSTLQAAVFL